MLSKIIAEALETREKRIEQLKKENRMLRARIAGLEMLDILNRIEKKKKI